MLQGLETGIYAVLSSATGGAAWLEDRARERLASSEALPFACAMLIIFVLTIILTFVFLVGVMICASILVELYIRVRRCGLPSDSAKQSPEQTRRARRKQLRTASARVPTPPLEPGKEAPESNDLPSLSPTRDESSKPRRRKKPQM